MDKQNPVYTLTNECHDCYKCVRECHVKAIKIENGHASVIPEKCIACGACVKACPTNAKRVRTDIDKVKKLLFDKKDGAILGFVFGLIVMINCITGLDPGGNILWNTNPFLTLVICFVKGIAAGFFPALLYSWICGKNEQLSVGKKYGAAMVAALTAPVVNTGLFVCGMLLFFKDTLSVWADGKPIVTYILLGLAGVNFLVEFFINIILTPAIVRIVDVVKKK